MKVLVEVVLDSGAAAPPPEDGTKLRVELRDTGEADAAARLVARWDGTVQRVGDSTIGTAVFDLDATTFDARSQITIWARCAASGAPRKSKGDWITMESIPLPSSPPAGELRIRAPVRRIG